MKFSFKRVGQFKKIGGFPIFSKKAADKFFRKNIIPERRFDTLFKKFSKDDSLMKFP